MELLPHFGVNGELSKEEFVRRLGRECTADQVRELRLSLFEDAVRKDLADIGDELVQRKKMGGGRSVKEKHIDDSWLLVGAIKRCECVPRILLKNGKRARNDLLKSQAKLREKRSGECQTTDVSKNVRKDAQDEIEDDDGKMLGGAGQGIAAGCWVWLGQVLISCWAGLVGWVLTGCLLWMPMAMATLVRRELSRMAKVMLGLIALDARMLCFVLR